jgi:hypothetical protein
MKTMTLNQMEMVQGGGNALKCVLDIGEGMIGGAAAGYLIAGAIFTTAAFGGFIIVGVGLYLAGAGMGLSSSHCMR